MRAIARILLLLLIVGCSVRFIATFIGLVLAFQHPALFSYATGRFAASALLLAIAAWAFRRVRDMGRAGGIGR
jgi:hypothetical protein